MPDISFTPLIGEHRVSSTGATLPSSPFTTHVIAPHLDLIRGILGVLPCSYRSRTKGVPRL